LPVSWMKADSRALSARLMSAYLREGEAR
jgi:hypothetical protein